MTFPLGPNIVRIMLLTCLIYIFLSQENSKLNAQLFIYLLIYLLVLYLWAVLLIARTVYVWWLMRSELERKRRKAVFGIITELAWGLKKPMEPRLGYPVSEPSFEPEIPRVALSTRPRRSIIANRTYMSGAFLQWASHIASSLETGHEFAVSMAKILERWLPVLRREIRDIEW